jgi:hypothetical protein
LAILDERGALPLKWMCLIGFWWFLVLCFVLYKIAKEFFGPPRKPKPCRCGHTCPTCKAWTAYTRANKPPCPTEGDPERWYFNDWDNRWEYMWWNTQSNLIT